MEISTERKATHDSNMQYGECICFVLLKSRVWARGECERSGTCRKGVVSGEVCGEVRDDELDEARVGAVNLLGNLLAASILAPLNCHFSLGGGAVLLLLFLLLWLLFFMLFCHLLVLTTKNPPRKTGPPEEKCQISRIKQSLAGPNHVRQFSNSCFVSQTPLHSLSVLCSLSREDPRCIFTAA
jgi:hypothetical protein